MGRVVSAFLLLAGMSVFPPSPARADTAGVEILDFGYLADDFVVAAGDQVKWVNTGAALHTVTADPAVVDRFDSGTLQPGASFARSFRDVGTFSYHCDIYRSMRATVHVTQDRTAVSRYRHPVSMRPAASGQSSSATTSPSATTSSSVPGTLLPPVKPMYPVPRLVSSAPAREVALPAPIGAPTPIDIAAPTAAAPSSPPGPGEAPPAGAAGQDPGLTKRTHSTGPEASVGRLLVAAGGVLLLANLRRRAPS